METKWIALFLLIASIASAETNTPTATRVTMHVATVKTDSGSELGQVQIVIGTVTNTFTSTNAINTFLDTLSKGTSIFYVAPYGQFHVMVGTNRMHIKDFGKMCRDKNIAFDGIIPDW